MSQQHVTMHTYGPEQATVARGIATTLNRIDGHQVDELNQMVERTGEAVILIQGYLTYRIEDMREQLKGRGTTPFVQKVSNRGMQIIRSCDDFTKALEPFINTDERKKAHLWFSDIIYNALDSLLADMHRDYPEPTAQVVRRAKLRYHDPYPAHVKECTAAFEDGYCKGYIDAMEDFIREVAALADNPNIQVHVRLEDGKIKLTPAS